MIPKQDYTHAMDSLFSDPTKFKPIKTDPTHRRLISIQNYLRTLVRRGELDKDSYKNIRPRNAKPARAHGLPKIHKAFHQLPKFRPIIDTTGTTHYSVGKFISELLQPLTLNEFTLKDTFDTANRIQAISPTLFAEGYEFVSFDVESLFTNVPLQRTLKIIIDRIYNKKLVKTNTRNLHFANLSATHARKLSFLATTSCMNKPMVLAWVDRSVQCWQILS